MTVQALNPESLAERMVAELNENPEARRLLLRALLTDEFLMLPAKVDRLMELPAKVDMLMELPGRVERLESDVSDLKAGQAELKAGQAELGAKQTKLEANQDKLAANQDKLAAKQDELGTNQTRMEGDIVDLKAIQARMQGHLGNLVGRDYEWRMVQSITHTVRRTLGMERARVLKGGSADASELSNKVADAETRGLISIDQGDKLFSADAVMSGIRQFDRSPFHAVAEISVTIGERDVERAAERAKILSAVMGEPAKAVVIGDSISAPDRRRAERDEVAVALIRQQKT